MEMCVEYNAFSSIHMYGLMTKVVLILSGLPLVAARTYVSRFLDTLLRVFGSGNGK